MSLPYGLLGLLSYIDATGYDLTKIFEDSLNNFWHAQSSQIYRELDRMEQKGWVKSRNVVQDKRPNKRVYEITEAGRVEYSRWLRDSAPPFDYPHEPLLMRIFFGADDGEATLEMLKAVRNRCLAAIDTYPARIMENIGRYADMVADGEQKRIYWEMTLEYGIVQAKTTAQWAQDCIDRIESVGGGLRTRDQNL